MKATAPVSARLPPDLVNIERTSEAVRLRLSVIASTIDGGAARAVALVADLVVVLGVAARALLDGALDVVLGHVLGPGRQDRGAQARVHVRIGHAHLGRDRDFAGELGEELRPDGVDAALAVHDVLELGMSGHGSLSLERVT